MNTEGWVASDATTYSLEDERPDWHSLVSVAVAVEDVESFNEAYFEIIEEKAEKHGININYPIIKNKDINRWAEDWNRKEIRKDIVTELLKIRDIDNIQITETSLHSEWVTVFKGQANKKRRVSSDEFLENYLQPYYNLVSIWEYLRKKDDRPRTQTNVMTDDFSGKISPAWIQIGEMADDLMVIPKGDQTYPLLSLADLTMELVKQEVTEWNEKQIYEFLKSQTPEDAAWVDSDAIDTEEELELIAPYTAHNINTHPHYPNPTIYIDNGSVSSSEVTSTDFFDHAIKFARTKEGCVKLLEPNQDRDYIGSDDYLIHLDNNTSMNSLDGLYRESSPNVLDVDEALELFDEHT